MSELVGYADVNQYPQVANGKALITLDGQISHANWSFCSMLGYSPDDVTDWGFQDLIHDDDRTLQMELVNQLKQNQLASCQMNVRLIHRSGMPLDVVFRMATVRDGNHEPRYIVVEIEEPMPTQPTYGKIEQKRDDVAPNVPRLTTSEQMAQFAAQVLHSVAEGVVVTDVDSRIVAINSAFTMITGFTEEEVLGKKPSMLRFGEHNIRLYQDMWNSLLTTGQWKGEFVNRNRGGKIYVEGISINAISEADGKVSYYVGVISDITEKKDLENRIRHQAYHDPLTGLANRRLFEERLSDAIAHARDNEHLVAVLFVDLDHFKFINDTLGHHQGDALLCMVAQRLERCVSKEDIVSRLGGDEFNILLPEMVDPDEAAKLADRMLAGLAEPFHIDGAEYFVSASIGISIFPTDGESEEALIRNADTAMYSAKKRRASFQFFTPLINEQYNARVRMQNDLRRAIEANELFLQYQPKVNPKNGHISGMEALVRWNHPTHGLIAPETFIPIAEETGLIISIGEWVLRNACQQNKRWQTSGLPNLRVSVNLSFLQIQHPTFIQSVHQILDDTGLDSRFLEFELTESAVMQDAEFAIRLLKQLRDIGIHISLDDFGAGYSSLNHLKQLPLNALKIDRSFVRDLGAGRVEREIVRVVIDLAHILNLKVVTEGVETTEQLQIVQEYQSDEIQGFLFYPPVTEDQMERLLRENMRYVKFSG